MSNFQYEITKHIGLISESPKGWTKELNLISWNNREPKYDLRDWAPEHCKMLPGTTRILSNKNQVSKFTIAIEASELMAIIIN